MAYKLHSITEYGIELNAFLISIFSKLFALLYSIQSILFAIYRNWSGLFAICDFDIFFITAFWIFSATIL